VGERQGQRRRARLKASQVAGRHTKSRRGPLEVEAQLPADSGEGSFANHGSLRCENPPMEVPAPSGGSVVIPRFDGDDAGGALGRRKKNSRSNDREYANRRGE